MLIGADGGASRGRVIFPIKHYKDAGFVERIIELDAIVDDYLSRHADFTYGEIVFENKRPMNTWLHAKCRSYVDTEASEEEQEDQVFELEAEVEVAGPYPRSEDEGE